MDPTITQNGALFAIHSRLTKRSQRASQNAETAHGDKTNSTLRTSVGEFSFRQTPLGCHLEVIVGNVRRALGSYRTNEAAVRALKNHKTGFHTWDALERKAAATQIGTLKRWDKGGQSS